MSEVNHITAKYSKLALLVIFIPIILGVIIGGSITSLHIVPFYICNEESNFCAIPELVSGVIEPEHPARDGCCRWWCCENGGVNHQHSPTSDMSNYFYEQQCVALSKPAKDENCNCYEVKYREGGKTKTEKVCYDVKMEGAYTRDEGRTWPRPVGFAIIFLFGAGGIISGIVVTCGVTSKVVMVFQSWQSKGIMTRFVQGNKHTQMHIVFTVPMQAVQMVQVQPGMQPYGIPVAQPYGAAPPPYGGAPPPPAYGAAPPAQYTSAPPAVPGAMPPPAYGGQPQPYGYAAPAGTSGPDPNMGYGSGIDGK